MTSEFACNYPFSRKNGFKHIEMQRNLLISSEFLCFWVCAG